MRAGGQAPPRRRNLSAEVSGRRTPADDALRPKEMAGSPWNPRKTRRLLWQANQDTTQNPRRSAFFA